MNVCLVMIVKNESHVIERCLRSVLPFITHWVICDTGSEDGTQGKIQEILQNIPGELHEDEWQDFAHNLTLAIQRAKGKGDWLLMMDADHEWHGKFPDHLTGDGYLVEHRYSWLTYGIPILMRGGAEWSYRYPVHETIEGRDTRPFAMLPSPPYVKVYPEGARSRDPLKYAKDAVVMQRFVDANPDDARGVYYLAQSYWNAGQVEEARKWYGRRAEMEGWWEERWHAAYRLAQTAQSLKLDFAVVMVEYLSAYQMNPTRAEPLVTLARYARMGDNPMFAIATMAARQARTIPRPPSTALFVEEPAYDWIPDDEFSISAAYIGQRDEAVKVAQQLLRNPRLPENERPRVEQNIAIMRGQQKAA